MGQKPKRRSMNQFTIIKDDPTDGHGGYGGGSISLENMSPVIIDTKEEDVFIDMDAMHARAEFERRVKYVQDPDEVPNKRRYWICWTVVERGEMGPYYYGIAASELLVDREARRAFKSMPQHVKHMEQSLKGEYELDHLDDTSKQLLREFLIEFDEDYWKRSPDTLKNALKTS